MSWHNKNYGAYDRNTSDAYDNALTAWGILYSRGWSLLAFCGMWGNVEAESGYNPWRWQSDIILSSDSPQIDYQNAHAYGLCQWDPAAKYINGGRNYSGYSPNFSNQSGGINDGTAQLNFLDDTAVSSGQYFPNPNYNYQISYSAYKQMTISNYSVEYATRAWFHNYERGTWSQTRVTAAQYWFETLGGVTPPEPPEPPTPSGNIPIWLLFKIKDRNRGEMS